MNNPNPHLNPFAITRIAVSQLFGQYSYDLPDLSESPRDISRVLILYGDNGSGKTTLLKLIYHLLSSEDNRGHRTFLARTRFKHLSVQLADGTTVSAERSGNSLVGSFRLAIERNARDRVHVDLETDEDGSIRDKASDNPVYHQALQMLEDLNIALYFLADDRRIQGNLIEPEQRRDDLAYYYFAQAHYTYRSTSTIDDPIRLWREANQEAGTVSLESAVNRVVDLIRRQVLAGSTRGEASTNSIYTEIIKRIAASPNLSKRASPDEIQHLSDTLESLAVRSETFSHFGLTSPLITKDLRAILADAPAERQAIIADVLRPYVDGIGARLDALQDVQDLITRFVNTVNSFYSNKQIQFDLREGVQIISRGEVLSPSVLSRGEKQLLLLMCNILGARAQPSIFLIDEPEISLNVKWQRQLVQALLDCIKGSRVQFLLATHSIELLARHSQQVVRLIDSAGRSDEQYTRATHDRRARRKVYTGAEAP